MSNNILQEFLLNKQGFTFHSVEPFYYWKDFPLDEDLSIRSVIVFKDYETVIAKYIVINGFYAFDAIPEQRRAGRTVHEALDFIRANAAVAITNELIIKTYNTTDSRISDISRELTSLSNQVTHVQRAFSTFSPKAEEHRALKNKLTDIQIQTLKLQRELKELNTIRSKIQDLPKR